MNDQKLVPYSGTDGVPEYYPITVFSNNLRVGARLILDQSTETIDTVPVAKVAIHIRVRVDILNPNGGTMPTIKDLLKSTFFSLPMGRTSSSHFSFTHNLGYFVIKEAKHLKYYQNLIKQNDFLILDVKNKLLSFGFKEGFNWSPASFDAYINHLKADLLSSLNTSHFALVSVSNDEVPKDFNYNWKGIAGV